MLVGGIYGLRDCRLQSHVKSAGWERKDDIAFYAVYQNKHGEKPNQTHWDEKPSLSDGTPYACRRPAWLRRGG